MKTLLILRHAKSSWANPGQDDWHRPLNERGQQDAPRVGDWLRERSLRPDLIITSDAVRARTTAQAVANAIGHAHEIVMEPGLYLAKPQAVIDLLTALEGDARTVMIVGHNPGLEELVLLLTGEHVGLVTAAIVEVELTIDRWSELDSAVTASIVSRWKPRE